MAFKAVENIPQPDPCFADLCVVENGMARRMTLADHHGALAIISLSGAGPADVAAAFDRARNTIVYAYFEQSLLLLPVIRFCVSGRAIGSAGRLRALHSQFNIALASALISTKIS